MGELERYAVTGMKYAGKAGSWDMTRISYNSFLDSEGLLEAVQGYMLGSRPGLDWTIKRYQVKTDKRPAL